MGALADSKIAESAERALKFHELDSIAPPKGSQELWNQFKGEAETEEIKLQAVENRFYAGYDPAELDWSRDVHAVFSDFKGDGMQMGMLLERFVQRGDQYVFVGDPPPFNGGWHFMAVNDFECPNEQRKLNPTWNNIRVWTRVNYVPTLTEDGRAALTPREAFNRDKRHEGAIPVATDFCFTCLYFVGGLMPHTMNVTPNFRGAGPPNFGGAGPASLVIQSHLDFKKTLAAIGHGLDVLLACEKSGTPGKSLIAGFEAAVYPNQAYRLTANGVKRFDGLVCMHEVDSKAVLVSAGCWGPATAEAWFKALNLTAPADVVEPNPDQVHVITLPGGEPFLNLDLSKLKGMNGAELSCGSEERTAVFVDEVVDPIEIYTMVAQLRKEELSFVLISASGGDKDIRMVSSETVFGNPMYGLRGCRCVVPTVPANKLPSGTKFDSFFVAGGQCPYELLGDEHVLAFMDGADLAAAVCHGPEALIGSKWLNPDGPFREAGFTAYYGCWMSFRNILDRFVPDGPDTVGVAKDGCRFFSGRNPNATAEMTKQACEGIKMMRSDKTKT